MINILTEKDIFITPNTNVSRESISRWVKNIADGVNKALENNNEAYLIKLHLSENTSVEWLGIFVKQLKQLIDETLDIPYIIIPVGGNCPVSDVTISKIIKIIDDDSVSLTAFNEKYEIVSQKGKIYVVREKEND